jgi:hypothetical protein
MVDVSQTIERITRVADKRGGLARLAETSGVPYTTLVDWKSKGWRPRGLEVVEALEKVADAADAIEPDEPGATP